MAFEHAQGTAVVTGASSGIGEVYAERLAGRGHDLILVARGREKLEALAKRITARTGRKVDVLVADLSRAEGQALVEKRLHEDKTITVLVNNAGIAVGGPLAEANPDEVESMLDINIVALTRLSIAAASAFSTRKAGTIINVASAMAFITTATSAAYSATKAYVLHFSRGLQEELAPSGVTVQAVLPGYTRTPLLDTPRLAGLPAEIVMPVDELVDAALAGLDLGETITIPSVTDLADWDALEAARLKLTQTLSRDHPAARYAIGRGKAA